MRHQNQCIISDHQFSNELGQTQTPCLVTKVVEEVTKKVAKAEMEKVGDTGDISLLFFFSWC